MPRIPYPSVHLRRMRLPQKAALICDANSYWFFGCTKTHPFSTFLIAQIQALFCGFIDLKRGQSGLSYPCPFLINSYRPGNYKVNPSYPALWNGHSVPECPAESSLSLSAAWAAPSKLGNLPYTGLGNLAISLFSIKSQIFFRNSSATKAQRHKEEVLILKLYQKKKNQ